MPELQITVSDLLERVATQEDRKNHIDIADLLIREMLNPVPREPSLGEIVAGLPEEAKKLRGFGAGSGVSEMTVTWRLHFYNKTKMRKLVHLFVCFPKYEYVSAIIIEP